MKYFSSICLVSAAAFGLCTGTARAVTVEQIMSISITASYLGTNVTATATNQTIKTAAITTATVTKALAFDLNMASGPVSAPGNLSNGQLVHIIDLIGGGETIWLRKGTVSNNVTSFFSSAFASNFFMTTATNDFAQTSLQEPTVSRTNRIDSLNSIALTTTNLSFILTNGFGTAFNFSHTAATNWLNLTCSGGVNLSTYNIGVWTNSAAFTNAVGPAHGTFSTSSGTFRQ